MSVSQEIIDRLAYLFRYFGEQQCKDESPFYANLSAQVAEDVELLKIASVTPRGQWVQNNFFAAVHDLLLRGIDHSLKHYYPTITETPGTDNPFPLFRAFCLEHAADIQKLLITRTSQTNEVGRCAVLLPAFHEVYKRAKKPLTLIEVGASAGLNLLFDRYGYLYSHNLIRGNIQSSVQLPCELRGEIQPDLPKQMPSIAERTGVDLHPINLQNEDEVRWLRALIWPDQVQRMRNLEAAIALAQVTPPKILTGDAFALVPHLIAKAKPDTTICVFHSFVLTQFSPEDRVRFYDLLAAQSYERHVYCVSMELMGTPLSELTLTVFRRGFNERYFLAFCHPHGHAVEWVYPNG